MGGTRRVSQVEVAYQMGGTVEAQHLCARARLVRRQSRQRPRLRPLALAEPAEAIDRLKRSISSKDQGESVPFPGPMIASAVGSLG
jgi:hypothetical protein